MANPLPIRLAYLAPLLAELAELDPDTLNESNEASLNSVDQAVRSHIRGLDESAAKSTIEQDCDALGVWLEDSESDDSSGPYVHGALLGMLMFADFAELVG